MYGIINLCLSVLYFGLLYLEKTFYRNRTAKELLSPEAYTDMIG